MEKTQKRKREKKRCPKKTIEPLETHNSFQRINNLAQKIKGERKKERKGILYGLGTPFYMF